MHFQHRLHKWWHSLRVRLTLWHTLVVLLAVLGALLAVREGLRYYLLQESEVVLNDEARELLLAIERWYPDREQVVAEMKRKASAHADRGWYIRWLSPDRKETIWASDLAPLTPLQSMRFTYQDYSVWVSDTQRSVERRLNIPGQPAYFVRVGTSTAFVDEDIDRLTRIAGPVAIGIILLAPLGGYFLSTRAVKPLREIIDTTDRLRPSQLHERLAVRDVGDELDQLALKINHFLDQIGEHLREHRDFVANAAHDLRSPLAAILSSVEVTVSLRRTPEEYEDLLFSIQEECRHLTQLVNQLLQLTEADAEIPPEFQHGVAVDEILQRSVEMLAPVAEERGVDLRIKSIESHPITGNRQQLRQLVTNLLDNAVKFTPSGGEVAVQLKWDAPARELELVVADTGIGISPEDVPRVFERFYQADRARSRRDDARRGNGLGLSICQAIVHLHHGSIQVQSELERGTTFTVRLPETPGAAPAN